MYTYCDAVGTYTHIYLHYFNHEHIIIALSFFCVLLRKSVVPSAGVMGLEGINSSSTSLTITWQPPPSDDQNGIIQAYNISYGPTTTQDRSLYTNTSTSDVMIELTSLDKFTFYDVIVVPYTIGPGPEELVTVQTDSDCKYTRK